MTELSTYWDEQSSAFDLEPDHGSRDPKIRAAWSDLLLSYLPATPASIADIGYGTGTLTVLLASLGYRCSGVDFSEGMINQAIRKAANAGISSDFAEADAMSPSWFAASFDCVVSRHVLWALSDPRLALERWSSLLRPGGVLVLIEGRWSTGAGLSAAETLSLLDGLGRTNTSIKLTNPTLWGGPINDERYLVVSKGP